MTVAKKASPKPLSSRESYKFLRVCRKHFPGPVVENIAFAYDLSKYGHHKQKRDNGDRYFDHPRAVSLILMRELGIFDCDLIIALLLHDMPEDSFLLNEYRIHQIFGNHVSHIVWLLTKQKAHKGKGVTKYFKRLYQSSNWWAMLAKCLDRLHNMRTLHGRPRDKHLGQVTETREKVLPLLDILDSIVPRKYAKQIIYVRKCLTDLCDHYEVGGAPAKLTKAMIV